GRDQHHTRQVRVAAGGAPDDRDRSSAQHAGDGRMHDRVLTRHHRGGSFHAARRRRGSGRRGADGERPVQRRHDRRRQDPPPHRTGAGCAEAVKGPTAGRAPQRRVAYEALEALGGSAPLRHLVSRLGLSPAVLDGLVKQRLARYSDVPRPRDPFAGLSSPPPPTPTEAQRAVVAGIVATPPDVPVLIHGVTGSGKTLVYLDLLRSVVASGQGAILLVPEIALTPQTVARVRGVFGDEVAVLHSGLSDGERADAWRAPRVAEARGIPWTELLDHAVRGALARAEQVILLLNRRGFATYLQCPACGDVRDCPHCAIALTVHQTPRVLRCHYCGHEEPIPTACRVCGKETQRMRGLGTQQLEHFVGRRFPEARIARMDL